jgi:hypothetical protein
MISLVQEQSLSLRRELKMARDTLGAKLEENVQGSK